MIKVREPTSIIDMVEMCRIANQRIVDTKTFGDNVRATARGVLEALSYADFYELDQSIVAATDDVFHNTYAGKNTDEMMIDEDCRLPSKVCAFWARGSRIHFEDREEDFPFMYLAEREDNGEIHVYAVSPHFAAMHQGCYIPAVAGSLKGPVAGSEHDMMRRAVHTLTLAAMCSILNQPSFTKREPAGSRQERRAAQRSGGYASDAWHKITWNIGEEVKAKLTRDEPVRCMPLHYTRGHWRRAEEGWKNTTLRKDGLWYQWIEGFWSGHPAFGIKKSYHAPKIGDAA